MRECVNCNWKGNEELDALNHCPNCGDDTKPVEDSKTKKETKKKENLLTDDRTIINSKKGKDGKFTATDLKDLNKKQQEIILSDFRLSDNEIKVFKSEARRIRKIMGLQKG